MPAGPSVRKIGNRPIENCDGSFVRSQKSVLRLICSGRFKSLNNFAVHAPAVTISFLVLIVLRLVTTRIPLLVDSMDSAFSFSATSAPEETAWLTCALMQGATSKNPAAGSKHPSQ